MRYGRAEDVAPTSFREFRMDRFSQHFTKHQFGVGHMDGNGHGDGDGHRWAEFYPNRQYKWRSFKGLYG